MSVRPLSPELAEIARLELNESPKRLHDGIHQIKAWIAKQPYLRARTDDQWIAAFLRGSRYNLDQTKQKIDLYYAMRSIAPELYALRHSDALYHEIVETGCYLFLPKLSEPKAPRVAILRFGVLDPEKYQLVHVLSVIHDINKIMFMEDDNAIVAGVHSVSDLKGVTHAHFLQFTPKIMKQMSVLGQDASPIRMKGSHYLNMTTAFEATFDTFKNIANKKARNKMYFYGENFEELYKNVPQGVLPTEYGGSGGSVQEIKEYWKSKLQEYGPWLEEDRQFGTDESKRRGKPKTAEDMFGIEGSFKKLGVD